MFAGFDLKDVSIIAGLFLMLVSGIAGYVRLTMRVSSNTKDICKNDKRIRKDVGDQDDRDEKRFDAIEEKAKSLRRDQSDSKTRLTKIEGDISHTRQAVDKMSNSVDEIAKQVTIVATRIDIDNRTNQ